MESVRKILNDYEQYEKKYADPKMDEFLLLSSISIPLQLALVYLSIVWIGPKIMKNRKPYELKTFTKLYNIVQICLSGYFIVSIYLATEVKPDGLWLLCKRWDPSVNEKTKHIAFLIYLNFLTRISELSETVVHILRKKGRQVSLLHVYHHAANVPFSWICAKYLPGGTASTLCLLNFFIHFIMYNYYLMSSSKSGTLKSIAYAFKPYLTQMQLIQFFYMIAIVVIDMKICYTEGLTLLPTVLILVHLVANIVLFTDFYVKNYTAVKKDKKMG